MIWYEPLRQKLNLAPMPNHPMIRAVSECEIPFEKGLTFQQGKVCCGHVDASKHHALEELIVQLVPWRKGPFRIGGLDVDAEWRSDLKWDRIAASLGHLAGARVLDLGCNNGYSMFRLLEAGADAVWGIDPVPRCLAQFALALKASGPQPLQLDPIGWQQCVDLNTELDLILCMGILYHHSDPFLLLKSLRKMLAKGGMLLLETIILPGEARHWIVPRDRYAQMRNVYFLPTLNALLDFAERCGFRRVELIEQHLHQSLEQHATRYAPGPSFEDFLMPGQPELTREGYPAPWRCSLLLRVD